MEKKVVIAKIQIIKGKEKEFQYLVSPLIEMSVAESGNLAYQLYQDIQTPFEFMAYEEYINEEAFNSHCNSEHFKIFAEQVKPLLATELDIQIF
ncbi:MULTISPECIES: putative quinol monooxygenase [Parabacteroides]|uniref:putative quinol monooxygenase n=1 Tax=Parabacteroides leei TaxID=2939491 RepID=UPI0018981DE6|nr:putative quinol monooxygenase [Parabacteroides goldsteinii]